MNARTRKAAREAEIAAREAGAYERPIKAAQLAGIVDHACARAALPRLPAFLTIERVVELGPTFRAFPPRLENDEITGARAWIRSVARDGGVEVELMRGGGWWVSSQSIRPIDYRTGETLPSLNEREFSR